MTNISWELAFRLIQGRIIAKALAKEVRSIQPPILPLPEKLEQKPHPVSLLYPPLQYRNVEPGTSEIIYDFTVPAGCVFHIELVGNNCFEDTYALWTCDGTLVEKVEREIGSINNPVSIRHRWLAAQHSVKWKFFNNSNVTVPAAVVIDGTIYLKSDFEKLWRRGG